MTESAPQPTVGGRARRPRVVLRIGYSILAVIVFFVFCVMTGLMILFEAPFMLLFGWVHFPFQVFPLTTASVQGIGLFAAVVLLLLTAGHRVVTGLAARMTPRRRWRLRDTGVVLTLCAAAFVAMVGVGGVLRQVGWMIESDEPMTEMDWVRMDPYVLRSPRLVCRAMQFPPDSLRGPEQRFLLRAVPVGHSTLHAIPLDLDETQQSAGTVLLFPRDSADLGLRGGLLCRPSMAPGPDPDLSASEVRARLAEIRRRPTAVAPPTRRP